MQAMVCRPLVYKTGEWYGPCLPHWPLASFCPTLHPFVCSYLAGFLGNPSTFLPQAFVLTGPLSGSGTLFLEPSAGLAQMLPPPEVFTCLHVSVGLRPPLPLFCITSVINLFPWSLVCGLSEGPLQHYLIVSCSIFSPSDTGWQLVGAQ